MTAPAHMVVAPIVLPLLAAASLLLLGDRRRRVAATLNVAATLAGLAVALLLLGTVDRSPTPLVYLASNWQAPFGISLVADRLSALMVVLVGLVGTGAALYAAAGWGRAGVYFNPLFQVQLAGLNGAFLTGDLFNLFVFFEVVLAASYGLQLHGSGLPRVRSGLHYLVVNLLASLLFLIGLAVIYGVSGTLSMADLADAVARLPSADRPLLLAGAAILAMAFLTKAATWPLGGWLVPAYTAAAMPVAAVFVLLTKVGVYALLRLSTLLFPATGVGVAGFGAGALLVIGIATLAAGAAGMLASIRLDRIAAFSVIASAGTLVGAIGLGSTPIVAAAVFYLVIASLSASALFLMVELAQRTSSQGGGPGPSGMELPSEEVVDGELLPADADPVGRVVPVPVALLALAFMALAVLVAGLPPLAGFVGKLALLLAISDGLAHGGGPAGAGWTFASLLLVTGFCAMVALVRAGVRHFWAKGGRSAPRIHALEATGLLVPLLACLAFTVAAAPLLRLTTATAQSLATPRDYIDAVLSARPQPGVAFNDAAGPGR